MLVVQPNLLMLLMFCSGKAFVCSNTKKTGPNNNVLLLSRCIISFQVYLSSGLRSQTKLALCKQDKINIPMLAERLL